VDVVPPVVGDRRCDRGHPFSDLHAVARPACFLESPDARGEPATAGDPRKRARRRRGARYPDGVDRRSSERLPRPAAAVCRGGSTVRRSEKSGGELFAIPPSELVTVPPSELVTVPPSELVFAVPPSELVFAVIPSEARDLSPESARFLGPAGSGRTGEGRLGMTNGMVRP
jgi:hypothetical protein